MAEFVAVIAPFVAIGTTFYAAATGFAARHDNCHTRQVNETWQYDADFERAYKRGKVTEEDWTVYQATLME